MIGLSLGAVAVAALAVGITMVKGYEQQLDVQKQAVAKLKQQLTALEAKYSATLSSRDTLITRQRLDACFAVMETRVQALDPLPALASLFRQCRQSAALLLAFGSQRRALGFDLRGQRRLRGHV